MLSADFKYVNARIRSVAYTSACTAVKAVRTLSRSSTVGFALIREIKEESKMDREILFRGKRINNGEWVEGDLVHSIYKLNDTCVGKYGCTLGMHQVIPETVGEFTGLLDKNGKRIFEGDILKCHDNPKDLVKVVFDEFGVVDTDTENPVDTVIGWHYEVIPTDELSTVEPFCLSMPLTNSYIKYCHMEVIGNIHDTP